MECPQTEHYEGCGGCSKRILLEQRLNVLKALVAATEVDIIENNKNINKLHDPLYKFPPEITSIIFEAAFEPESSINRTEHDDPTTYTTCPLLLGGVCSHWRAIAWGNPQLWTRVSWTLCPGENICYRINLLQEYIERSGALPLHMRVLKSMDNSKPSRVSRSVSNLLVETLGSCLSRCRSIALNCSSDVLEQISVRLAVPIAQPILQSLQLSIPNDTVEAFSLPDLTPATKNLEHLKLGNLIYIDQVKISYTNLRRIEHVCGTARAILHALSQSPFLLKASFEIIPKTISAVTPQIHNDLRSLSITGRTFSSIISIIDSLTLPSLTELSIVRLDQTGAQSLQRLIERSGCNISKFSIQYFQSSALMSLHTLLLNLPGLQTVCLHNMRILNIATFCAVFDRFSRSQESRKQQPCLPNLEELDFNGTWIPADEWGVILKMIVRLIRRQPTPPSITSSDRSQTHQSLKFRKLNAVCARRHRHSSESAELLDDNALGLVQRLNRQGIVIRIKTFDDSGGEVDFIAASIHQRQLRNQSTSLGEGPQD